MNFGVRYLMRTALCRRVVTLPRRQSTFNNHLTLNNTRVFQRFLSTTNTATTLSSSNDSNSDNNNNNNTANNTRYDPQDQGVSRWLYASAALVFGMVVVGGVTRLTESGLSITDWKPLVGVRSFHFISYHIKRRGRRVDFDFYILLHCSTDQTAYE
jgi:hypothetical protein